MVRFEPGVVTIKLSKHGHIALVTIDAMVAMGTDLCYHRIPQNTMLYKRCPDGWMVSWVSRGSCVTSSILPADPETAEMLIAYVHEHRKCDQQLDYDLIVQCSTPEEELIAQCAARGGHWFFVNGGHR